MWNVGRKRYDSMYDIYLLRHGRSLTDDENRCEGRYDSPLTLKGKEQAKKTAEYFIKNDINFDKIISSPLIRAKETAEIINNLQCTNLELEPLLMEKDNGLLAGELIDEMKEKYPLPNFVSPFMFPPSNTGENLVLLHARAGMALSRILEEDEGKYLIVSHGNFLNALIRNILSIPMPVDKSGQYFLFEDNSILHLKYDKSCHKWFFCSFNCNVK